MKKILASMMLLCVFATASYSMDPVLDVEVGNKGITVPDVQGYVGRFAPEDPLMEHFSLFIPKGFTLKGVYINDEFNSAFQAGVEQPLTDYLLIAAADYFEDKVMDAEMFMELKQEVRDVDFDSREVTEAMNNLNDEAVSNFNSQSDINLSDMTSGVNPIGIVDETENSIVSLVIINVDGKVDGKKITVSQVATTCLLRVKGKLFSLYCYDEYDGTKASIDNISKRSVDITNWILATNS
ncbi:MAG: hypothetical protein ACNI27_08715 [Desulfovibrio sp.]